MTKGCTKNEAEYFQKGWVAAMDFMKNKEKHTNKTHQSEENTPVEKPKSIWKDAGELPINEVDVLMRLKNDSEVISGMWCWDKFVAFGNDRVISNDDILEYCELTDWVNKLEGK